jgi:hypothetical protein
VKGVQQFAFPVHDAKLFRVDFDALGERTKIIAAIGAIARFGKDLDRLGCDGWTSRFIAPSALSVSTGLVPDRFQFGDAVLQHHVLQHHLDHAWGRRRGPG